MQDLADATLEVISKKLISEYGGDFTIVWIKYEQIVFISCLCRR